MAHDAKGRLLRNGDGNPQPREEYRIDGIHCLPETFAPLCLEDRLRFGKKYDPKAVDTHQYIISFAPSDRDKGLTMEKAHRFGLALAKKNFPGHRCLVCTHPDGANGTGNIHVHIVISSLRFEDRPPAPEYMRQDRGGRVLASEWKAGCAHQDTGRLRRHLMGQINDYCRQHGYTICPEQSARKVSQEEFFIQCRDVESRNDQLRRVISDAAAATDRWDVFCGKLQTDYTRMVPVIPPVPNVVRRQFWDRYRLLNRTYRDWDKSLRSSIRTDLDRAFAKLKGCKNKAKREELKHRISNLKEQQKKLRLFRQTWQTYAQAATMALGCRDTGNAFACLEELQELSRRREGYWKDGWDPASGSYSLRGKSVGSRVSWQQITEADLQRAKETLEEVQQDAVLYRSAAGELMEIPLPVEAKLSRGEVSFKHPDSEHWIRGKRLGADYTLEALGIAPPGTWRRAQTRTPTYQR